jgi:hypothetical protein
MYIIIILFVELYVIKSFTHFSHAYNHISQIPSQSSSSDACIAPTWQVSTIAMYILQLSSSFFLTITHSISLYVFVLPVFIRYLQHYHKSPELLRDVTHSCQYIHGSYTDVEVLRYVSDANRTPFPRLFIAQKLLFFNLNIIPSLKF